MAWRENATYSERLKTIGRSQGELAAELGISSSSMSRLLNGGRKALSVEEVARIEAVLARWEGDEPEAAPPSPRGTIPLLGRLFPGETDKFIWNLDQPIDWVEEPPFMPTGLQVAALRVPCDKMDPRLYSGEIVYLGVGLAPARGGDCVVEFKDGGCAVLKSYIGRRDEMVRVYQFNPAEEIAYPEAEVAALHAVMWRR